MEIKEDGALVCNVCRVDVPSLDLHLRPCFDSKRNKHQEWLSDHHRSFKQFVKRAGGLTAEAA